MNKLKKFNYYYPILLSKKLIIKFTIEEYANFKTLRSYVNSIFDWAEELEYIETNRISKIIGRIKSTKKIRLKEETCICPKSN